MGLLGLATGALGLLGDWTGKVRIDHPVAYKFKVDINGVFDSGFKSAKGLSDRMTPLKIKSANKQTAKKVYVLNQVGLVTLERALDFNGGLERWYDEVRDFPRGGRDPRRSVTITQLYSVPATVPLIGGTSVGVRVWHLPKCSIVGTTSPNFDAMKMSSISNVSFTLDPNGISEQSDLGDFAQLLDVMKRFS